MWLIDTETLELKSVAGPESQRYAILSHTWVDGEEASFQEFLHHKQAPQVQQKTGFAKIAKTCSLARERGIAYAWVDTCCIDKSSSAELSEAINSMFKWYQQSTVCFVYLADLAASEMSKIKHCRWFSRGWTLQELIASPVAEFYDASWTTIGNKKSLLWTLVSITKIDDRVLSDSSLLPTVAVAQRMSWAAKRQTTRVEDLAYCLFGLFDVNLPLIYGEGTKAFIRLQEAIIRESDDLSLFAWTSQEDEALQRYRGIFARAPEEFAGCGGIVRDTSPLIPSAILSLNNKGLEITTTGIILSSSVRPSWDTTSCDYGDYFMDLRCFDFSNNDSLPPEDDPSHVAIYLVRGTDKYVRHRFQSTMRVPYSVAPMPLLAHNNTSTAIHVPKLLQQLESWALEPLILTKFKIVWELPRGLAGAILEPRPLRLWEPMDESFITMRSGLFTAKFRVEVRGAPFEVERQQMLPTTERHDTWLYPLEIEIGLETRPTPRPVDRIGPLPEVRPYIAISHIAGGTPGLAMSVENVRSSDLWLTLDFGLDRESHKTGYGTLEYHKVVIKGSFQ
ncbi:heterokaryon incompatibility protein-domain-containing protein [Cercophora scortea]|uniref:Heterokaryon incompatibility protein-domain-containing protein n=1 Tax=Cercophora scortea TaxID=314031 RepID=A0AAE0M711_9PEZI|nr:heterokaryon incompatibility protein-domain-containing protein [Cercophora scortea]